MNSLVETVEIALDKRCQRRRCRKEGCRLNLPALPKSNKKERGRHLLIDLDCRHLTIGGGKIICDFLYITDNDFIAVIELKKGDAKIVDAQEQLQAGAKFVEQLVGTLGAQVQFRPVLGHGGRLRGQSRQKHWHRKAPRQTGQRKIEAEQIRFNGQWYQVRTLRCGMDLVRAFR